METEKCICSSKSGLTYGRLRLLVVFESLCNGQAPFLPSGDPQFEVKAHQAMEAIWRSRHRGHNLVGSVINVHSAD